MMLQHTRVLMEQKEEIEDCIEVLSNILNLTFSRDMVRNSLKRGVVLKFSPIY